VSKFYRYLKFDNDNSTIRFVGLDATIDNGVTITSGGQTITAGGQTVTAGVWYVQTGTATTTWKQFATPF